MLSLSNNYDVDIESGLTAGDNIKKYNTADDYEQEDDCEVYGEATPKKSKLREIVKRYACTTAGFVCFGVFVSGALFFAVTSLREGQIDNANQVMDLIDSIHPVPHPPDLYMPSDMITPTLLIPSMMPINNIGRPEGRVPRRRRY